MDLLLASNSTKNNNDGFNGGVGLSYVEKEHMFDKVVTPSDVGKLNRLVIPKQHAEKYFPLDFSSDEKGLLLNFEDRNGKSWRFRYSYWNSSQSYVITKGWSRFVKDKKLDAGDVVSFHRGVGELGRHKLYIDWRRRPVTFPGHATGFDLARFRFENEASFRQASAVRSSTRFYPLPPHQSLSSPRLECDSINRHVRSDSQNGQLFQPHYAGNAYDLRSQQHPGTPHHHQAGWVGIGVAGGDRNVVPMMIDSVPIVHGKAAGKRRLRLFGVNMECGAATTLDDHEPSQSASTSTSTFPRVQWSAMGSQHLASYSISSPQLETPTFTPSTMQVHDSVRKGKASLSFDLDIADHDL